VWKRSLHLPPFARVGGSGNHRFSIGQRWFCGVIRFLTRSSPVTLNDALSEDFIEYSLAPSSAEFHLYIKSCNLQPLKVIRSDLALTPEWTAMLQTTEAFPSKEPTNTILKGFHFHRCGLYSLKGERIESVNLTNWIRRMGVCRYDEKYYWNLSKLHLTGIISNLLRKFCKEKFHFPFRSYIEEFGMNVFIFELRVKWTAWNLL